MSFWDRRYNTTTYVYGTEPNLFFREHLERMSPGSILLPGEGEGRNAVFAAQSGWKVTAFDTSAEGRKKALRLAAKNKVSIRYDLLPYLEFDHKVIYDAAGLFFTHQPPEMRKRFHLNLQQSLKPGGIILIETFHKDQVFRDSGGPRDEDLLFSEEELREDFSHMEVVELQTVTRHLDEGPFHQGEAVVVQMVARKKKL